MKVDGSQFLLVAFIIGFPVLVIAAFFIAKSYKERKGAPLRIALIGAIAVGATGFLLGLYFRFPWWFFLIYVPIIFSAGLSIYTYLMLPELIRRFMEKEK